MLRIAHPYDDPAHWADAGIYKRPDFAAASYQKKLDKIVGTANGYHIVRLSWSWDCRKLENTEWDFAGNAVAGEWRQRYRALSIDIGNDDYVDISPPRWVLEERYEPTALAVSWETTRYRRVITEQPPPMCRSCKNMGAWIPLESVPMAWFDASRCKDDRMWIDWWHPDYSEGHLLMCRFCDEFTELASVNQDVWGEVPREGWYNLLPHIGIIADHDKHCCKKAKDLDEICYGLYKLPDNYELSRLTRAIALRSKDAATNPNISPELDEVALQQAKRWGLQLMEDAKVSKRGELAEIRREHRPSTRLYA